MKLKIFFPILPIIGIAVAYFLNPEDNKNLKNNAVNQDRVITKYFINRNDKVVIKSKGINVFCLRGTKDCFSANIPEKYENSKFSFLIHPSQGNCRIRSIHTGATFPLTSCESNGVGD